MDRAIAIGLTSFLVTASLLAIPAVAHPRGDHGAVMTRDAVEARVAERFAAADIDGDGAITRDEIRARGEARRAQRLERRFQRMDVDGDGEISVEERDVARERRQTRRAARREARRAVRREDMMVPQERNMRARLTDEEMRPLMEGRRSARAERRAAAWASADANGNGMLDRTEFAAMADMRRARMQERIANGEARGRMARRANRRAGRFDRQDVNGDGVLTLAELSTRALERFDAADADSDGTVTRAERRAARQAHRAMRIENRHNRVY